MIEEVRLAAGLAKIRLDEDELKAYERAFEYAFNSFKPIVSAEAHLEPLIYGVENVTCVLREDNHRGDFDRDAIFACAPDVQDGCFAVPRILE